MVICLERCAELHIAQLMPLPLIISLVLPLWYRLTRVVLDKGPLNGCVCVCVSHKVVSTNVRITLFYSVHLFSFSFKLLKYMYELILTEFLESILIHAMLFECICS